MLEEMLADLKQCSEKDFASYFQQKDLFGSRVSAAEYFDLYRKSCADGIRLASSFRHLPPSALADQLGVTVRQMPDDGQAGIVFGLFTEPDDIEIAYAKAREAQDLVDAADPDFLGDAKLEDILLAHELFHVLQLSHPELVCSQKLVTTFKLGRLERKAPLSSLEEAGAMAFAKELLGLDFHPSILDILLCLPRFPERSKELYDFMMTIRKDNV